MITIRTTAVLLTLAASSFSFAEESSSKPPAEALPVLTGYCPIDLIDSKTWTMGKPEFETTYDGETYRFSSAEAKAKFLGQPNKYVPALHGDCVVSLTSDGVRVPGKIEFCVFYNSRIYLMKDADSKKLFTENPSRFGRKDVAWNGDCSVCLIDAQIRKPGTTSFIAHYRGLRYLFPNDILVRKFNSNPSKYEDTSIPTAVGGTEITRTKDIKTSPIAKLTTRKVSKAGGVSVRGRSACALCEFGVGPIGAPDELGLAITSKEGTIYIIEDAHTKYPELYEEREEAVTLELSGTVLKSEGKFTWVAPESLSVVH